MLIRLHLTLDLTVIPTYGVDTGSYTALWNISQLLKGNPILPPLLKTIQMTWIGLDLMKTREELSEQNALQEAENIQKILVSPAYSNSISSLMLVCDLKQNLARSIEITLRQLFSLLHAQGMLHIEPCPGERYC